jgi:hypothetical protein
MIIRVPAARARIGRSTKPILVKLEEHQNFDISYTRIWFSNKLYLRSTLKIILNNYLIYSFKTKPIVKSQFCTDDEWEKIFELILS